MQNLIYSLDNNIDVENGFKQFGQYALKLSWNLQIDDIV